MDSCEINNYRDSLKTPSNSPFMGRTQTSWKDLVRKMLK